MRSISTAKSSEEPTATSQQSNNKLLENNMKDGHVLSILDKANSNSNGDNKNDDNKSNFGDDSKNSENCSASTKLEKNNNKNNADTNSNNTSVGNNNDNEETSTGNKLSSLETLES